MYVQKIENAGRCYVSAIDGGVRTTATCDCNSYCYYALTCVGTSVGHDVSGSRRSLQQRDCRERRTRGQVLATDQRSRRRAASGESRVCNGNTTNNSASAPRTAGDGVKIDGSTSAGPRLLTPTSRTSRLLK